MKTILLFSILFCAIAMPLCAQAQAPDDTLKKDVAVIQNELKNIKETITNGFDNVQKNFDRQNNIIIACIGIPWVFITIAATLWGILVHRRNVKDGSQQKEIETLTQEIETLKQRIASL